MNQDNVLTVLSYVATAIGGGGLIKVILDKFFTSAHTKLADGAAIRKELWEQLAERDEVIAQLRKDHDERINALRREFDDRIKTFQDEVDSWREKYHSEHSRVLDERSEKHLLVSELTAMKIKLSQLTRQVGEVSNEVSIHTAAETE